MKGKMPESGSPDVTPFICTSAVQGQSPVFSHPQFFRAHHREWPKDNPGGRLLCHSGSYNALTPRLSGVRPEETTHLTRGARELSQPQSCARRCRITTGSQRGRALEAEPPAQGPEPPTWAGAALGVRIPPGSRPFAGPQGHPPGGHRQTTSS